MLYDKRWDAKIDNDTVQALCKAKDLIADGSKWCCDTYAQSDLGIQIHPNHPRAVSFCSVGALAHVMEVDAGAAEMSLPGQFLVDAAQQIGQCHPTNLNDGYGHSAALQMFDRAIELARAVS